MSDYIIYTDSSCDLSNDQLQNMSVRYSSLDYFFGEDAQASPISSTEFYDKLRQGKAVKTSAVNSQTFFEGFEPILKKGMDILYLGMSSGLSTTFNSACIAARQLRDIYPCRKIITVDTLSVSAGLGLILDYICKKKENGATIDEAANCANDIKNKICHIFTVNDLNYLKRGGRISSATATVGSILGIKPILHVDEHGKLVSIGKVRGRHAAIVALAEKYKLHCTDKSENIYIAHGDCKEDADELSRIIKSHTKANKIVITDVGPVIGAHSGPETLALFYVGDR